MTSPEALALMTAIPFPTEVTTPSVVTVATAVSDVDHVAVAPLTGVVCGLGVLEPSDTLVGGEVGVWLSPPHPTNSITTERPMSLLDIYVLITWSFTNGSLS